VLTAKASQLRYLKLDALAADPKLARRLPPDLAWRCHALPLAEDNGRITVAMADPEDTEAREAVVAALGPQSCVVQGSALAIDAQLTEIWGNEACDRLKLALCSYPDPPPKELWDYTKALGALLGARLGNVSTAGEMNALIKKGERADCDMIILGRRRHPMVQRLLSPSAAEDSLTAQQSTFPLAILVAHQPRWPLERILLVICGESADDRAVDWALRLARPSAAAITVLSVVPPVPAMYHGLSRMEQSVAALLATDTTLGRQMHQAARRLAECGVNGTLRLRQGAPDQQICREVVEGNHDLIVMATTPCRWWLRELEGDPICSLLGWVDRPVLLAGPTTA
jgi:nucleotide-binding universal stress UspA family protein